VSGGKKIATLQRECDAFNREFPVGSTVEYTSYPGAPAQRFTTRTEASVLSGHTSVVWLNGKSGCVCISHCKKLFPETTGSTT
jgi:hypothetical protein